MIYQHTFPSSPSCEYRNASARTVGRQYGSPSGVSEWILVDVHVCSAAASRCRFLDMKRRKMVQFGIKFGI